MHVNISRHVFTTSVNDGIDVLKTSYIGDDDDILFIANSFNGRLLLGNFVDIEHKTSSFFNSSSGGTSNPLDPHALLEAPMTVSNNERARRVPGAAATAAC